MTVCQLGTAAVPWLLSAPAVAESTPAASEAPAAYTTESCTHELQVDEQSYRWNVPAYSYTVPNLYISAAIDIRYPHLDILTYLHSDICRIINWSCSLVVAIFVIM